MTKEPLHFHRQPSPLGDSRAADGAPEAADDQLSDGSVSSHTIASETGVKIRVKAPPDRTLSSPSIGTPLKSDGPGGCRSVAPGLQTEVPSRGFSSDYEADASHFNLSGQSSAHGSSPDLPAVQLSALSLSKISPTFSSSSNLIGRAHQRENEARKLFGLPSSEALIDDWNCALHTHRGLLLQGHLYLFLQFICFYSNVFGVSKKLILPCKDVLSIRKRKNAGVIPNSIEVVYRGKDYFFTSFLSRDDAFHCICSQWYQFSEHSQLFDGKRSLSDPMACLNSASEQSLQKETTSPADSDGGGRARQGRKKKKGGHAGISCLRGPACMMDESPSKEEEIMTDSTDDDAARRSGSDGSDEDFVAEPRESFSWQPSNDLAPPIPSRFKPLCSKTLKCTPREFFDRFLHQESVFWKAMLEEMGNKEVKFDSWMCHPKLGRVRNVSFIAPVKASFAPPETRCHQSQRYCVFASNHLTLDTSQVMMDIPYGDHFSVEMRWDITEKLGSSCEVSVLIDIPFSRKTMFKGTIEKTSMTESTAFFHRWMQLAELQLAQSPSDKPVSYLRTPRTSLGGLPCQRASSATPLFRMPSLSHWEPSNGRHSFAEQRPAHEPCSRSSRAALRLPGAGLVWGLVQGISRGLTSVVQAGVSMLTQGGSQPPTWALVITAAFLLQPAMRLMTGTTGAGDRSAMTAAQQVELQLRTVQLQEKLLEMQQQMMDLQQTLAQNSGATCGARANDNGPFGWRT